MPKPFSPISQQDVARAIDLIEVARGKNPPCNAYVLNVAPSEENLAGLGGVIVAIHLDSLPPDALSTALLFLNYLHKNSDDVPSVLSSEVQISIEGMTFDGSLSD